jgi:hypothetical protein
MQQKNDDPEQYKAIGVVQGKWVTLIFEIRHDDEGAYEHFVTLWNPRKERQKSMKKISKKALCDEKLP